MVSYGALKAVCKAGDDVERQRSALKKLFGSFVKCDKNVVRTQVWWYSSDVPYKHSVRDRVGVDVLRFVWEFVHVFFRVYKMKSHYYP